jgi:acetoin utilization protein AcuB
MLVGDRMSRPAITIKPDVPIQDALILMHKEHIRRFPVVDQKGRLIGMVSERDLLNASPSEATSLSVWELNYLISKITVERVMTHSIITVAEDTPIEEAARIMADNDIGALPVLDGNTIVGMITETDLFKIFLELFAARDPGIRVTVLISDKPGTLHEITGAISRVGGNILALGSFLSGEKDKKEITIKTGNLSIDKVRSIIAPCVEKIVDIREVRAY